MRNLVVSLMLVFLLTGCGQVGRIVAKITGKSRSCIDGVEYLQFASGVTVAYNYDGSIKNCED